MTKLWAFKIYVHISTRFEPPESVLYLKFMPDAEYDRTGWRKVQMCYTHTHCEGKLYSKFENLNFRARKERIFYQIKIPSISWDFDFPS